MKKAILAVLLLCLSAHLSMAQGRKTSSYPYSTGSSVPASCTAPSLFYKTATTQGLYQCVAGVYVALGGGAGAPVGGSGTADFVPYFTAATTLGNGPMRFTANHLFIHPGQSTRKVSIGNDIDVIPAAALEINSTTLGFVPPRVTTTQRDAMSPVAGWSIHNTTTTRQSWYSGTAWVEPVDNTTTQTIAGAKTFSTGPVFSTPLLVPSGGTGLATATAYALLAGGTTSTGAFQSLAGVGTTGQVLTSNGAGALPTFQAASGGGTAPTLRPSSRVPVTSGFVFPNVHVAAGSGWKYFDGMGIVDATTLTGDAIWAILYQLPPSLPTGTAKHRLRCISGLSTGDLKINVKWNTCAAGTDCSGLTLQAEGTQTASFTVVDAFVELLTTLDAATVTANQAIVMNLTIENTGTTTAGVVTCDADIIWVP
jgi:hypothetical protein